MAQKTFPCTACGQPIEVPDDFKPAVIDCPACKAPHSRHSERPYVSPRATRMAGAPLVAANMQPPMPPQMPQGAMPPPMAPGPMPYPARPFMGPPPQPKNNMGLIVGLSIAGAFIVGMALLALIPLLFMGSSAPPGPASVPSGPVSSSRASVGEVPPDWVKFSSKEGRFRAEFPIKPTVSTENAETGVGDRTMTLTSAQVGGVDFFIHFWDLGMERPSEYIINLQETTDAVANYTQTSIVEQRPIKFGSNSGTYAMLRRNMSGHKIHIARLRVGNRVFTICADGLDRDATPYYERFFQSFNFDEELNYLEPLYFELPGNLELQTRQTVAYRLRGSGGKVPYTWKAEGLPRGLSLTTGDFASCDLTGTPEEIGTFAATITMADDLKREFKSTLRLEITKSPDNAGNMQIPLIKGRAGLPVSGKVIFKPAQTPESVNWKWDAAKVPKGVQLDVFTPDLVVSGVPTQSGKFSLDLEVSVKFKNLELELTTRGTLEFDFIEAWPDVTARFGKATLILLHNGNYSPEPWKYLLNELARKCGQLGEGDKINLWTLTGFGRSISTKSAAPQPKTASESVIKLLKRDADAPKQRGGAAHKDLATIPIADFSGYDKVILVTDLRAEDSAEPARLQAELERIAATPGLALEIVVIAREVPAALKTWLEEKKITLTHYVP